MLLLFGFFVLGVVCGCVCVCVCVCVADLEGDGGGVGEGRIGEWAGETESYGN